MTSSFETPLRVAIAGGVKPWEVPTQGPTQWNFIPHSLRSVAKTNLYDTMKSSLICLVNKGLSFVKRDDLYETKYASGDLR